MGARNTTFGISSFLSARGSLKSSHRKRALVLLVTIATVMFSTASLAHADSLNVNLDQCANGVPRQTVNCTWQNGDLNAQNSQWREGDGVPFRVVFSGLTADADHSVHINYDFFDNGKHAYDTLEDYNATISNPPISDSLPTGITFPSGSAISTAFPHDALLTGYNPETGLSRHLTTYGAATVTMGALTHDGDTGDLVVNFHVPASSDGTVVMLWAGHLAIGATGWGVGLGAASISGAPFHMRTQQLDGSGNKNQDRSIQPAAIVLLPSLSITKTADAGTVNAGQQIGYTIAVANAGPGDATGVKLSDTLPTNTGLSWSIASQSAGWGGTCAITTGVLSCGGASGVTLAAGGSLSVHIISPTTAATCGTVSNSASVTSTNGGSDSAGPVTITVNCPTLSITKVADATTVNSGQTIGYTITVHNAGPGDATGVKLSDTLPTNAGLNWSIASQSAGWGGTCAITTGVLSCGGATGVALVSGASLSVHITSPTTAATCGTVSNSASATSGNDGSPSVGPVNITVNCPNVSITKAADSNAVKGGDTIGFTITVSNAGPGDAFGVKLSDTLPSGGGLSWTITSASAGWGGTCSITAGVLTCGGANGVTLASGGSLSVHISSPTTAAECGSTVDNTGAVTLTNGTGGQDGDSIDVTCPVLSIHLAKDGPQAAHVGDTIHYTLTVVNGTDEPLFDITVTDPICNAPPVYQSGDTNTDQILQSGETWIYTCDHVVTASDPDPLPNTATVVGQDKLGRETSAQASHSVDILHPAISIAKTANPISGAPGDTVTYTFVVTNTSTDTTLFNITVVDDKLGNIGTIASLAPGQSVTLTKTTTLPNSGGLLTNVGTATGADVLGKTVTAHDNATVTVVLAILPKTGTNGSTSTGLVGLLFVAVGVVMATRKERGRVRPAFASSSSVAGREVMLAAHRRSWRMRRRRGPPTRARLRWRRSQGPPMRDGP